MDDVVGRRLQMIDRRSVELLVRMSCGKQAINSSKESFNVVLYKYSNDENTLFPSINESMTVYLLECHEYTQTMQLYQCTRKQVRKSNTLDPTRARVGPFGRVTLLFADLISKVRTAFQKSSKTYTFFQFA